MTDELKKRLLEEVVIFSGKQEAERYWRASSNATMDPALNQSAVNARPANPVAGPSEMKNSTNSRPVA